MLCARVVYGLRFSFENIHTHRTFILVCTIRRIVTFLSTLEANHVTHIPGGPALRATRLGFLFELLESLTPLVTRVSFIFRLFGAFILAGFGLLDIVGKIWNISAFLVFPWQYLGIPLPRR